MSAEVRFSCSCGAVEGAICGVTPRSVNRVVCSCSGCQRYARALGREELLDEYGGTDIIQASPADFEVRSGGEQIACVRQTRKGALRWYTRCCGTPLANTLANSGVPFMGFFVGTLEHGGERPSAEVIGPVRARVNGAYEPAVARRLRATTGALVPMLARVSWLMLRWRLGGAHKRWPMDWATPIEREVQITETAA